MPQTKWVSVERKKKKRRGESIVVDEELIVSGVFLWFTHPPNTHPTPEFRVRALEGKFYGWELGQNAACAKSKIISFGGNLSFVTPAPRGWGSSGRTRVYLWSLGVERAWEWLELQRREGYWQGCQTVWKRSWQLRAWCYDPGNLSWAERRKEPRHGVAHRIVWWLLFPPAVVK